MNYHADNEKVLGRLVPGQRLAVLATYGSAGPYLSLVAIVAGADLHSFYFATPRNTRKFANLETESRVALLIDDRPDASADFSRAAAATITGTAQELSGEERSAALELYQARHPSLAGFARSAESALFKVTVSGIHLANGFS